MRAFATRAVLFNLLTLPIPMEHVLCIMFVLLTLTIPRSFYLSENECFDSVDSCLTAQPRHCVHSFFGA